MIGSTIHRHGTVTSTNDVARELIEQGAVEGVVVVADEQTKGRGSRGRIWLSPPARNLLLSVILRPNIPMERMGELAFVAAVAVANTLRDHCGLDAKIKWPNDLRVGGRKIAGIIVETTKSAAVLGIGVNVNWTDFPEEIASSATSIALELGKTADLNHLLKALLADLDITYGVYRARGFARVLQDWRQFQTTIGSEVTVRLNGADLQGLAVDVDEHGSLIVELPTGEHKVIPAAALVSSGG